MPLSSDAEEIFRLFLIVISGITLATVCRILQPSMATGIVSARAAVFYLWGSVAIPEAVSFFLHDRPQDMVTFLRIWFAPSLAMAWLAMVCIIIRVGSVRYLVPASIILAVTHCFLMALFLPTLWERAPIPIVAAVFVLEICTLVLSSRSRQPLHAWGRSLLYGLGTFSTLLYFLPRLIRDSLALSSPPNPPWQPGSAGWVSALFLIVPALLLFLEATRAMAGTGGTPDPADPPPSLITSGIFACLRHPLHIAECLIACASIPLFRTGSSTADFPIWLYALVVVLVILGPWRHLEEILLVQKFGDTARKYNLTVPPYGISSRLWRGRHPNDVDF